MEDFKRMTLDNFPKTDKVYRKFMYDKSIEFLTHLDETTETITRSHGSSLADKLVVVKHTFVQVSLHDVVSRFNTFRYSDMPS